MSAMSCVFMSTSHFLGTPILTLSASTAVKPIISGEPSPEVYLSLLPSRVQCLSLKPRLRLKCPLCPQPSGSGVGFSAHEHGHSAGILHGRYSAILKNRIHLILGARKNKNINDCSSMRIRLLRPRDGAPESCIEGASNEPRCISLRHHLSVLEKFP